MTLIIFLGALSLSVLAFELLSGFQTAVSGFGRQSRLAAITGSNPAASAIHHSTWEALLVNLLPGRFDPARAKRAVNVVDSLRRAGYPYDTPGEFYAAAMRTFSIYLVVASLFAGALVFLNLPIAAPVLAAVFIFLGLRRPYTRLILLAKNAPRPCGITC